MQSMPLPRQPNCELRSAPATVQGEAGVRVDIQDFGPGISVENRSQIFEPFREILNASCFDAEVAYSAAQAVDVALERCPNVVIADVVMPEKTGIELAIILSSICPAARILLMSG